MLVKCKDGKFACKKCLDDYNSTIQCGLEHATSCTEPRCRFYVGSALELEKIPMDDAIRMSLGLPASTHNYALLDDSTAAKYVKWLMKSQWRIKDVLRNQWGSVNGFWVECSGCRLPIAWNCIPLAEPCNSQNFMAAVEMSMASVLFSSF